MEPIHLNSVVFHLLLLLASPLFLELFSINCNAIRQCLQTESSALLQLKRGFTSRDLDTWRPGTDCCVWEGVTCDDESGRVTGLDLSFRFISGKIDSSLFNLTSLQTLNFADNWFNQTPIPDFGWDKLANLSSLRLSNSRFAGKVPVGISRLKKLTSLDLSYNRGLSLTNNPTFFKNMSSLKELYLSSINLSAYVDEWCGSLVNSTPILEVLSMDNCSLFGPGCSSLSKLPLLSVVRFGGNNLDSSILDAFVNFTSLSELEVQENEFNGVFPKQIFQLRNLIALDISINPMLSGSLPEFSEENNLKFLGLYDTNLSGSLPDTINNLKFLIYLDFSNCQFSGRMPPTMSNLSHLEVLSLSYNNFSGIVELEFIKNLNNLYLLDLSNSGFSLSSWDADNGSSSSFFSNILFLGLAGCNLTKIPTSIKHHYMEVLDLSNNNIHGEIPSWFWSISYLNLSCNFFTHIVEPSFNLSASNYLSYIDLHSNMLEGSIPLLPSNDIRFLDFSDNRLTSFISSNIFSYLNFTRFFSLANNNLTGEIPPSICNLTNLQILDLSNNRLNGSIPPCLLEKEIHFLVLNLFRNQLHGVIPHEISLKCSLQAINLKDNHLEGLLPRSLTNCRSLEILDLGNNNLNDTFPYWLGNISSLKVLVLRSNEFHGLVGPLNGNHEMNSSFSMLHVLDISSNNFSGNLCAECFSSFKSMMIHRAHIEQNFIYFSSKYYDLNVVIMTKGQEMILQMSHMIKAIDFSNNHFEGEIPITIGQLVSLQTLNMSQNHLTGKIPSQLRNLTQLESLDLSMNSLSGKIPQELVSLSFLSYLNLSYNKLVGMCPLGGQFFSNTSFEGNEGLSCSPHNKSVPKVIITMASKNISYMIVLGILFGVGFGGCMAIVIVVDVVYCDRGRRRSQRPLNG